MTVSSVADWDNEYARLARVASQLRTTGLSSSTTTTAQDVKALSMGLQRLDASLGTLQQSQQLAMAEVQRRRRLLQHLQQTTTTTTTTTTAQSSSQPQSQMTMALRQQDDLIDELATGVGRLKHQTIAIGEEASMHVNLLETMDTNLEAAQADLQAETRRAQQLRQDSTLWQLQLTVAGLFILLILLILMGLSP